MASLLARIVASFDAIKPVPTLTGLDGEHNQLVGASGVLNGNSTASKLLVKTSDGSDPPVDQDQVGAGLLARWKQNGTLKASITNAGQITTAIATGTSPLSVVSTTVCTNLNADKVDGFDIPGDKTAFALSFGVADPSTPPVGGIISGTTTWVCPDGNSVTITKLSVLFLSGSHTAGGSVSFLVRIRTASSSWVNAIDLGPVTLDNTNNTVNVVYTSDIADQALSAGDSVFIYVSARSGTVTERDVSVVARGTQKFTT